MDIDTVNEIITLLKEYRDSGLRIDSERVLESPVGEPRKQHLVLAVGHSRATDNGAVACDGRTDEWTYNRNLAHFIDLYMDDDNIDVTIVDVYKGNTYSEAMMNLKMAVDPLDADLVVELHFNSYHKPSANGYEALYWHSSTKGKDAAETFVDTFETEYPSNLKRGSKPIQDNNQRGARFLKALKAPCVILEPFFGSNPKEWEMFQDTNGKQHLAKTIATSLNKCFLDWRK
jgi:N-acetylmuramoyl-L-alanine amidase